MKKFINYFLSFFKKDDPFFYGNSKLKDNFFQDYFTVHTHLQIGL